jgi:hypothetical protein
MHKEELKNLIREAISNADLEEGWLDRLKAKGKSAFKGRNKKGSQAKSLVSGFKKKAFEFLMDLEKLVGSDPEVQEMIKSVEGQVQDLVSSLENVSSELAGAGWYEPEPEKPEWTSNDLKPYFGDDEIEFDDDMYKRPKRKFVFPDLDFDDPNTEYTTAMGPDNPLGRPLRVPPKRPKKDKKQKPRRRSANARNALDRARQRTRKKAGAPVGIAEGDK